MTPETSYGFAVIDFARDVLAEPLDPWERLAVIRGGELLEDGRPRFRQVLIIVARQNGKTHLIRVLILFWMFVEVWPQILGIGKDRAGAKKLLERCYYHYILRYPEFEDLMPKTGNRGYSKVVGLEALTTIESSEYFIGAPNSKAGRGDSLDRVVCDELREYRSWDAYNAAIRGMNARPHGQAFFITNQGEDTAVVLHALRTQAIDFINTGEGDDSLCLMEWSPPGNPDEIDVLDPENWAYANPNLGHRVDVRSIRAQAIAANTGDKENADFKTEVLCLRVKVLNPAVNPLKWSRCYVPGQIDLATARMAWCLDIAPDGLHATLAAAMVQADNRVRVEVLKTWDGPFTTKQLRTDLPHYVQEHKPNAIGWFPNGPAAMLAAELKDRTKMGRYGWPPPGVKVEEIKTETNAVCMGFATLVRDEQVLHDNEAILNDHVTGASKLESGDTWKFQRSGEGHCDAAYAAAGAAFLAQTLPTSLGSIRVVGPSEDPPAS